MNDQPKLVSGRWWRPMRLSVRVLVVTVLLSGGGLGWWLRSVRSQREAVEAVQKVGGYVTYDWEFKDGETFETGRPPWPEWLVRLIGTDGFSSVTVVQYGGATV